MAQKQLSFGAYLAKPPGSTVVDEEIKERLTHNAAIVLSSQFYARSSP